MDKRKNGKQFRMQLVAFLRAFNSLLSTIENQFDAPGFHLKLSTRNKSQQLNGFFQSNSIREILESTDYKCLDMCFPFVAEYIERVTRYRIILLGQTFAQIPQHSSIHISKPKPHSTAINTTAKGKVQLSQIFVQDGIYVSLQHVFSTSRRMEMCNESTANLLENGRNTVITAITILTHTIRKKLKSRLLLPNSLRSPALRWDPFLFHYYTCKSFTEILSTSN